LETSKLPPPTVKLLQNEVISSYMCRFLFASHTERSAGILKQKISSSVVFFVSSSPLPLAAQDQLNDGEDE
jgi:hypothetical protein